MEWNASLLPPPTLPPHSILSSLWTVYDSLRRDDLERELSFPGTQKKWPFNSSAKSIMRYNGMLHPCLFPIVFFPVSGQFMVLYGAMICKRELSCPETQQKWPLNSSNPSLFVAIFPLANKWVGELGWTYYEEELILWCLFTWQGLSQMTLFHTESYTFGYSNSGL